MASLKYLTRALGPSETKDGALMAWTPGDDAAWVLQIERSSCALYRLDGSSLEIRGAGRKALGLEGVEAAELFTGADGALRLYGGEEDKPAGVWRLDGSRFVAEKVVGLPIANGDAFCGDASNGRFFHLQKESGTVFELQGAAFRKAGELGTGLYRLLTVWDRARSAVVVLTDANQSGLRTLVVKDGAVASLEGVPYAKRYGESFRWSMRLVNEPASGRAMILKLPGGASWEGAEIASPFVLGAKGWEERKGAEPAPDAYGFISRAGDVVAAGAGRIPTAVKSWTSNTAARREWALFDGKKWSPHGRIVPVTFDLIAETDPPLLNLGGGVVAPLSPEGEIGEPFTVEKLTAVVAAPGGPLFPTTEGVASRKAGKLTLAKDKTALPNDPAWVWHDRMGALLSIGGKVAEKPGTWTWAFQGGKWSEPKTRGKPYRQYAGIAGYHATRGVVVLAGGFTKKFCRQTAEFDGKAWTVFEEELPWDSTSRAKSIVFDPTSGQLFALVAFDTERTVFGLELFRYAGEGAWESGGELLFETPGGSGFKTLLGGFSAGFDPSTRRVLAAGPVDDGSGVAGVLAADVAALLDSWPRPGAAPVAKKAPKPFLPVRRLVMKEEGVGKYWIAELSGKSWTARWGKRGTEGQSKEYRLASPEKAEKDFSKKVQEKLDKGYLDAPEGEDPSVIAGRNGWAIKLGRPQKGADHFYGLPPIAAKQWPLCRSCKKPMQHLATFFRDDERLPLATHAAMAVFACGEVKCEAWDPDKGANAVLLLPQKELAAKPSAPEGVDASGEQGLRYGKAVFEADPAKEELEPESPGGCKMGGFPGWVQDGEIPVCDRCKKPMLFVAQLDSGDTGMNFGDVGVGYVFRCPDEHGGKFLSQSS